MFAQLFGYYLLDKNIISPDQLNEALVNKNIYKERLGSLFVESGYMTNEQVEYIHSEQKRFDKNMGDLAVFLGFLSRAQMEELLGKQNNGDIALADALLNKGYITKTEYDNLLKAYRQELGLTSEVDSRNDLKRDIISIYNLDEMKNSDAYADYASLFVRNSVRFVGDDFAFTSFNPVKDTEQECMIMQDIKGPDSLRTAICGSQKAFNAFAARCAGKDTFDCSNRDVANFLNLQNGLYAANVFASDSSKLSLGKIGYSQDELIGTEKDKLIIPLSFTFGKIYIYIFKM